MKKLRWCTKIKEGIKLTEPNETISSSYLNLAKSSLRRAEVMLKENDLLWSTVMLYYAEYYALYAFLVRIGVKCENHSCSILLVKHLLGADKIATIEAHKERRIDAQYYLKISSGEEIRKMFQEAKFFISFFDDLISQIGQTKLTSFRNKIFALKHN